MCAYILHLTVMTEQTNEKKLSQSQKMYRRDIVHTASNPYALACSTLTKMEQITNFTAYTDCDIDARDWTEILQ